MLTPIEFIAEPRYKLLIITAPNDIDEQWRCEMTTLAGDKYSGFGANGYQAFAAMMHRYRDTDPDTGPITMTINPERGQHRRE